MYSVTHSRLLIFTRDQNERSLTSAYVLRVIVIVVHIHLFSGPVSRVKHVHLRGISAIQSESHSSSVSVSSTSEQARVRRFLYLTDTKQPPSCTPTFLHVPLDIVKRVPLMCNTPINGCPANRCLFDPRWPVNMPIYLRLGLS